jgi:hypothetical protein
VGAFAEVNPLGHGRYAATLDHGWDVARYPQGGIVASLALRAAE